ncbi:MAG: putative DNA binding domain-containing protein [Chlorobi bacterium]|nr:putative DNA binding domain-containing protein [Chlorobiota bacterium]
METTTTEYKSIKKIRGGSADFKDLSKTCVCLANAQGGRLVIGIEDKESDPPKDQTVGNEELNKVVSRLRSLTFSVGFAQFEIIKHENGSEYIQIVIQPSLSTIATTSEGRIYIRVVDKCEPVRSEDVVHLAAQKNSFQWELVNKQLLLSAIPNQRRDDFVKAIRASDKASDFIVRKTDEEILEFYNLVSDGKLTNLGVLWLGNHIQKSRISYPLTIQYIVYNDREEKIRKETWLMTDLDPKELLLEIEQAATELKYFFELPQGLFRKNIRHYPEEVVRELLVNAIAHKSYTISGDIFIEVYPDRLTITNPGGLPLGITVENILHERFRRNPHLINIMHDMGLMEGEGSGYDIIYEKMIRDAKEYPLLYTDYNKFSVTIFSNILDREVLEMIDYIVNHFRLSQKEIITLGVIARNKKILSTELSTILQLKHEDRLRSWVSKLIAQKIVISRGHKKGTSYLINPEILAKSKLNIKPSLKTIEDHRLKALIEEDLKTYSGSQISDIQNRIIDIPIKELRKIVYKMVKEGTIAHDGGTKFRKYSLAKKKIK